MITAQVFFSLVAWHFIMDFPLQGDTTAREKNRHAFTTLQRYVPWYYWMLAHAFQHAFAVYVLVGNLGCALGELLLHFAIDTGKCERWYSIHVDQTLHLACKGLWLYLVLYAG